MISMSGLDLSFMKEGPPPRWHNQPREKKYVRYADKKSDLACPRIILDRVEYKSMATGEMITSRSQHREHLKRHDLIEVGNEPVVNKKLVEKERKAKRRKEIHNDVMEAVKMYNEGYRPPPAPDAEKVGIEATPGQPFVRAEAPKESGLVGI